MATISGLIDGLAGFGPAFSNILFAALIKKQPDGHYTNWQTAFLILTIVTFTSAFPVLYFVYKDIKKWRNG